MNKKLYLIFIGLLILCSGCSAEYTLTVHDDLSVTENFTAMEDAEFYNSYNSSAQKVISFIIEPNKEYFNSNGYQVDQVIHQADAGIKAEKHFISIEDFKEKSQIPNQISDDWSYIDNGESITFKLHGVLNQNEQDQNGRFVIDEAKIKLIIPFEVIDHNADSVNKNTYIWELDSKNLEKDISITFNKTKKVDKEEEPPYIIFGIIIVAILIVGIVIYSMIQSNKNRNNLDD